MGKSTTAKMFQELGVPVWDADATVHRLYSKNGAAVQPIRELHPPAYKEDAIDRSALKDFIANNANGLSQIEAIVHPLVAEDRQAFLSANKNGPVLFDIPLLFETGADQWLDAVIVVTAPAEVQKSRVLARPDMTPDQFAHILSKQMPDAEKRKRADFVIETTSLEAARKAVLDIVSSIRQGS